MKEFVIKFAAKKPKVMKIIVIILMLMNKRNQNKELSLRVIILF